MGADNTVAARTIDLLSAVSPQSPGEASQLVDEGGPVAVLGMPEQIYHGRPELSASQMKILLRSPKAFRAAQSDPEERKPHFTLGTAVHTRVLGVGLPIVRIPETLLSGQYQAIQSKDAKAWVAEQEQGGKTPLKPKDYEFTVRASDAVLKHPKARRYFEDQAGVSEVSLFGYDAQYGVPVRSRLDRVCGLEIVDLKTAEDLSTRRLQAVIDGYNYDLSMEHYRFMFELVTGQVADPAVLVFVEKKAPFDLRVVKLGEDEWIDGGWQKRTRALEIFTKAVESGSWPGVDEEGPVESLPVPSWYRSRVNAGELEVLEEGA